MSSIFFRSVLFFVLLSTSTLDSLAQNMVKGFVVSQGTPLEYATVSIEGSSISTLTDSSGFFRLSNIPSGKHRVRINQIGYQEQFIPINALKRSNIELGSIQMESSASLQEVVVSGTMNEMQKMDSPVPVEVYSFRYFRANPNPSMFESLQNINGVRPQINCNVCNTGDIHINGLEGPYTMVLIDGMPIVSGLSTVYGLTGIPQSMIERVEVVKGPASTLYGSEAVGGLINIITKDASTSPILSAEMFGTAWAELNTDIGGRVSLGKKLSTMFGINHFHYQTPVDRNHDNFTDITLQHRVSVFSKWDLKREDGKSLSIAGRYLYEDRWGGEMQWSPELRGGDSIYGESIYTNRWELFGRIGIPVKEDIEFQFSANGHEQNSVYGNMSYIGEQYVGFGQFIWRKKAGSRHQFLSGLVYRYTYYDDNTFATAEFDTINAPVNQPSVIHLPGLFIQDEILLTETHKILLGLRYDYNFAHGNILSPRLNYQWKSRSDRTTFRLGAGNGFRVANVFTEDHAALTGARQVEFVGKLKPETSWNGNINFVKQIVSIPHAILTIDASAWYTHFTNRILPDYETDPNKIIYSNLQGHAVSTGSSLNMNISLTNGIRAMMGVTYMDASTYENGIKARQLLTEQFSGVWNIGYHTARLRLRIDYTGNLYSPMLLPLLGSLDDRPSTSPWFSIQNIQITKTIGRKWEIYGGVKNLLNFTPPANSIARSFDPFDNGVSLSPDGQVIPTASNPNALTFDPSYMFAPNQGIRGFLGFRYTLSK